MKKLLVALVGVMLMIPNTNNAQESDTLSAKNLFGDLRARHIGPALMKPILLILGSSMREPQVVGYGNLMTLQPPLIQFLTIMHSLLAL